MLVVGSGDETALCALQCVLARAVSCYTKLEKAITGSNQRSMILGIAGVKVKPELNAERIPRQLRLAMASGNSAP